jgi:hypothetical protein
MTDAKPAAPLTGLALLRSPFPDHLISKLPKPTKQQTEAVKNDFKLGIRCKDCGAWHHKDVVHLDYVGHAALTHRLLDVDPEWSWEPAAFRDGLPAFDATGGLWIKLTVLGVTRLGYGHAAGKLNADPGAREKEVIGDALRNAAMRFGAALDLWHKGDLHVTDAAPEKADDGEKVSEGDSAAADFAIATMRTCRNMAELTDFWGKNAKPLKVQLSAAEFSRVEKAKDEEKARHTAGETPFDREAA